MSSRTIIFFLLVWPFNSQVFGQGAPLVQPKPIATQPNQGTLDGSSSWFEILLEKNPGIVTIVISSFFLPIAILFLTNRQARKLKEIESSLDISKSQQQQKYSDSREFSKQQSADQAFVYGCLVTLLFDVQRLHIDLSIDCQNINCVKDALARFDKSLTENHSSIASRLSQLPSAVTGVVYRFYQKLGELIIDLRSLERSDDFELCYVATYQHSQELANEVISLHRAISERYETLKAEYDEMHLQSIRTCCGRAPHPGFVERFKRVKQELADRNDPSQTLPVIPTTTASEGV
ncbi:hypothetical protein [Roseiconus lacunae]|uniref:DUF4760 domain-containing protein n=1 Tax=Roseiconus lacunae TaxID=2605694 RepID=A0ABT7PNR6_9BACT|nr:hypothetical protein [Roseiconus lacunae]MDM4018150.1 hypothetical protein [Roseiconus lacunae]